VIDQPDLVSTIPPGQPGLAPRWTSSAKAGVGTAFGSDSRVWFTISHGIINEVYYPTVDQANTRDLGFLITDRSDFFSEEKRNAVSETSWVTPGVPAYQLVNTCSEGRYRIRKVILTDPRRDVLLQRTTFEALRGSIGDYGLYALLAPHIGNRGYGNDAWVWEYKGVTMLFARRENTTLALACSALFLQASCGYVGTSDGWQDIMAHRRMTWCYPSAPSGNVALTAEIDLAACAGDFDLALAFGSSPEEAGQNARAALLDDFDGALRDYVRGWSDFQERCLNLRRGRRDDPYHASTAVLKTHVAKSSPGGTIASLSVPWGSSKGDDDLGGYHLVWSRDLVEAAGGLLAAGDLEGARQALLYLMSTQEADGHWPQNMWLNGKPFWTGVQMDETALPILLAALLHRSGTLDEQTLWPWIRKAAAFLVCNGPVTQQDRWEEDGGFSPFTLAAEVAALLVAADFAEAADERGIAAYLRQTADAWNANIEHWTYVTGGELAEQLGIEGYYVRIAPPECADAPSPTSGFVPIKNRPPAEATAPCIQIVSPDALAFVRFGLRAADDPRIVNTTRAIDATLKVETATGPTWRRYSGDGYGEHADGSPFDGTGIGQGVASSSRRTGSLRTGTWKPR
jgi:glucoamylase